MKRKSLLKWLAMLAIVLMAGLLPFTVVARTADGNAAASKVAPRANFDGFDPKDFVDSASVGFFTFKNDSNAPWTTDAETGVARSGAHDGTHEDGDQVSSKLTVNFTANVDGQITFDANNFASYYHFCEVYIDNKKLSNLNSSPYEKSFDFAVTAGQHTIQFVDTINEYYNNWDQYTTVQNLKFTPFEFIEVESDSRGVAASLVGTFVQTLSEVRYLRITAGPLNSKTISDIQNMKNLVALDITALVADEIPASAFTASDLPNLVYIKLPQNIKSIGNRAFYETNVSIFDIPASVENIGEDAFYNSDMYEINFPAESMLTTIGDYAFRKNDCLNEVTIPASVSTLGRYLFFRCDLLRNVVFKSQLTEIPDGCFSDCSSLENVTLLSTLERIGSNAFLNTSSLGDVVLPDGITDIGGSAFRESGLSSIKLPANLSTIPYDCFYSCNNLKEVMLPNALSTIGSDAFYYCNSLEKVISRSVNVPSVNTNSVYDSFRSVDIANVELQVPPSVSKDYRMDSFWKDFNIVDGEEPDRWDVWGELYLDNSMRPAAGLAPDINIYGDGHMVVYGNAAMQIKSLDLTFSPDGEAAFDTQSDYVTARNIITHYELPALTWYFFSPISDIAISDLSIVASDGTTPSYALRYYDGADRAANGPGASWKDFTGDMLKAGTGYILQTSKAATLSMPLQQADFVKVVGRPDVTIPLSEYISTTIGDQSWNLVGNPFAAYYDIFYMQFTAPITVWNGRGYSAYRVVDETSTYALSPMQAFFVQTPEQISSITFPIKGRQWTSDIDHAVNAPDAGERTRFIYDIELMYDNKDSVETADRTRVVINPEAAFEYELECDASKFMSFDKTVPQMYTFDDANTRMSINERPLGDGIVRLGLYLPAKTIYTITAPRAQGEVWLYDSETSQETLLSEGAEYSFTSRTGGYSDSRFTLRFNVTPTAIDAVENESVSVESGEGFIEVKAGAEATVAIASADGVLYYIGEAARVEVPQGIYVVKVGAGSYKTIVK